MLPKTFYIRQDQVDYLKKLPGNVSDHIRRAIDDYIISMNAKKISESASPRIGGEE